MGVPESLWGGRNKANVRSEICRGIVSWIIVGANKVKLSCDGGKGPCASSGQRQRPKRSQEAACVWEDMSKPGCENKGDRRSGKGPLNRQFEEKRR